METYKRVYVLRKLKKPYVLRHNLIWMELGENAIFTWLSDKAYHIYMPNVKLLFGLWSAYISLNSLVAIELFQLVNMMSIPTEWYSFTSYMDGFQMSFFTNFTIQHIPRAINIMVGKLTRVTGKMPSAMVYADLVLPFWLDQSVSIFSRIVIVGKKKGKKKRSCSFNKTKISTFDLLHLTIFLLSSAIWANRTKLDKFHPLIDSWKF